jgi:hypothetical protein
MTFGILESRVLTFPSKTAALQPFRSHPWARLAVPVLKTHNETNLNSCFWNNFCLYRIILDVVAE